MTIGSDIQHEVEVLVPAARGVRWGVQLAVGLVALALVSFVVWYVVIRPGQNADNAKRAQGAAIVADSTAKATADAQRTVVDHYNHDAVTVTLQQKGSTDVQAAAGSRDPFPTAVGDAARRAVCMYAAAGRDPACVELHDAGAIGMADRDTVRAAPEN